MRDERGGELAAVAREPRLEIPVGRRRGTRSRSSSRSTISRTATLCTRPALRPVCTFFQSTGDSV